MRYGLWSHNRLIGYTALDYPHFLEHLRHGFIEPTPAGEQPLRDAVGVFTFCGRRSRASRRAGMTDAEMTAFLSACEARESLDLELRDENGARFECDFIRIYPTADLEIDDDFDDDDHSEGFDDLFAGESEDDGSAFDDSIRLLEELQEEHRWSDGDDWQPEDERWTTMPYFIQVFLQRPDRAREPWRTQGDDSIGYPT